VELPGRLRALARAPLKDQEVPPRRRDQGPGVLARRDVDSPSRIVTSEGAGAPSYSCAAPCVWTGDTGTVQLFLRFGRARRATPDR
jgi:hypothetical protein